MREIKFRAWYEKHNKMYNYVEHVTYPDGSSGTGCIGYLDGGRMFSPDDHHVVLMQYTGLKDGKGTEIYEGDIVKWKIFPEDEDPKYIMDVVVYRGGCFALQKRIELLGGIAPYRRLEVVGNIHENPHLLN